MLLALINVVIGTVCSRAPLMFLLHAHVHVYSMYMYMYVNSFKETRQSKQLRPKTTPFFLERKNELPWAGFEPATFCVLGERSTN